MSIGFAAATTFRVPVGAGFAAQDLKLKSVYIIQDKTLYGQGVADNFRAEARKLGMKILGYEGTEERANFSPLIIPLKARNPDLVYFGGIYHQGGLLLKQLRERGVKARYMGPDGLDSPEMVKIGGGNALRTALVVYLRQAESRSGQSVTALPSFGNACSLANLASCQAQSRMITGITAASPAV